MTLTTHAIAGAAAAELFPAHPIIGFIAGFTTHFLLDAIPHFDYKIYSAYANPDIAMSHNESGATTSAGIKLDKDFLIDITRIGSDCVLGFLLAFLIFHPFNWHDAGIVFLGAVAGVLPDFLHFVYMRLPYQPMIALEKFHMWIHSKLRLKEYPMTGVVSQIALIVVIVVTAKFLLRI